MMFAWIFRLGRLMGFWLCLSMVLVMVLGGSTIFRHQLRSGEARLEALEAKEEELRAGMDRLAMEWSRLNQPAQLADLARRHLDLRPIPISPPAEFVEVLAPAPVPGDAGR